MPFPFQHVRPGPLSIEAAEVINRALDELDRLLNMTVTPPLILDSSGGTYTLTSVVDAGFWARLDSESAGAYAWTEMVETTVGTFAVKSNGRTGTTSSEPAYERNATTGLAANTIVWMQKGFNNTTGSQEYLFSYDDGSRAATGYNQAQNAGSNVTQRKIFNASSGLAAADNGGSARTDLTWAPQTWPSSSITVGNGSQSSIAITYFVSIGTSPIITYSNYSVTITSATLILSGGSTSASSFRMTSQTPPSSRTNGDLFLSACNLWNKTSCGDKKLVPVTGYPDLLADMLAFYKLDETAGPTAADSSGNSRDLTDLNNNCNFNTKLKGGVGVGIPTLNDTIHRLKRAAHTYGLSSGDSVSLAATMEWTGKSTSSNYQVLKTGCIGVYFDTAAGVFKATVTTNVTSYTATGATQAANNRAYSVCARFNKSTDTLDLLVDGSVDGTTGTSGNIVDANDEFVIESTGSGSRQQLVVYRVGVWKHALTATELTGLTAGVNYPFGGFISPGDMGTGPTLKTKALRGDGTYGDIPSIKRLKAREYQ